jgi:signal transduction histidine kinase
MANVPFARILSFADRAFGVLLYAYPAAHRREFGPWMAQLFRDLCRDAIRRNGIVGLAGLWLRTLLDVAHTAFVEHLDGKGQTLVGSILERQGLVPALQDYAGRTADEVSCALHLAVQGDVPRLTAQAESALFDMVQEAVTNAERHAQASNVWIVLSRRQDILEVSVRDDGRGFDLEAVRSGARSRSTGAEGGAHDRTESLQGTFTVESAIGQGTTVRLVSPLAPNLVTAGG